MKGKIAAGLVLVTVAGLGVWALVFHRTGSRPPVEVRLSFSVAPKEQVEFVMGQARSAKLKYDVAKEAGLKPALGERLIVKTVPGSALAEAQVRVGTKEEGERFVSAFMAVLQMRCQAQAKVALTRSEVR
ncbi:MAG TPA: hypothetical protein VJA21_26920 [Verrucomicrobiae bacterium]